MKRHLFRGILISLISAILISTTSCEAAEPTKLGLDKIDEHAAKVAKKLPEGFSVVTDSPFVVAGNMPEKDLNRYVERTIKWASKAFDKQFLDKQPDSVITIYLFKNDKTYRKYAKELFGDEPSTPYGYFMQSQNRMMMNIATGGGTLVHELWHALVRYDFPGIPDWFNEGMGSLYEQCAYSDGKLLGLINWRYPVLTKHLKKKTNRPLADVISYKKSDFYSKDNGSHYAVARYFCQYLQHKGVLEKFYARFRDNFKTDPTGEIALEKLLSKPLAQIEKDFLTWSKTLKPSR